MVKSKLIPILQIAPALVLFSCAAPKAVVVAEPKPAPKKEVEPAPVAPEPTLPAAAADDGIRLQQDLLALPGDEVFKPTTPVAPQTSDGSNAVIVRPPTDPPSRPKPSEPVLPATSAPSVPSTPPEPQ